MPFTLLVSLLFSTAPVQQKQAPQPRKGPLTVAQQLVNQFVPAHPELSALEVAVTSNGQCKTIAATAPEDVGERCDADELGPIRTGKPDVEIPTKDDPVYDITQALHDASGRLIGAVGMDLKPTAGPTREAVVARARELLRDLEAQIASKARLMERVMPNSDFDPDVVLRSGVRDRGTAPFRSSHPARAHTVQTPVGAKGR